MRRGPACGPPITQPAVALSTTNSTQAASNAPVPKSSDSSRQCTPGSSVTTRTMLTVDTRRSGSCSHAASSGRRAPRCNPISNGASTVKIKVRTIAPAPYRNAVQKNGQHERLSHDPHQQQDHHETDSECRIAFDHRYQLDQHANAPGAVANTSSDAVSTGSRLTTRETPRAIAGNTTKSPAVHGQASDDHGARRKCPGP